MRRAPVAVVLATAALAFAATAQDPPPDELARLEPVLRAAIARVAPSVVTVETFGGARRSLAGRVRVPSDAPADSQQPSEPRPPDQPAKPPDEKDGEKDGDQKGGDGGRPKPMLRPPGFMQAQGATTGVVLSADGWIAVSRFGLSFDPSTVLVTLPDGRSLPARCAGADTSRGLALLKIESAGLPVPEFVPPEAVRVGQWAVVLGRTFGREQPSVHLGIVSARGRLFGRAIQTDANTSPANYGGPLIDVEGRVLGICVPLSREGRDAGAELYDSGIGFAVSPVGIEPLLERLRRGVVLHRGWLGVATAADDLGPGARLGTVAENSPALAAGLAAGDRIVAVDGVPVRNPFHLADLVSARMGGEVLRVDVVRAGGECAQLEVALADLPEEERAPKKREDEAGVLPWEGEKKDAR